jgi:hypothetical protein
MRLQPEAASAVFEFFSVADSFRRGAGTHTLWRRSEKKRVPNREDEGGN